MVHFQWGSPYDIVHQYHDAGVDVAPPQLYEIQRLMEFSTVSDLLKCAWQSGQHRVQRYLPVRATSLDGILSLLPGDSLYPPDTDPEGPAVTHTHNKTLAELEKDYPLKHRFQFRHGDSPSEGRVRFHVMCNISLPGQHVAPRSTQDILEESAQLTPKL